MEDAMQKGLISLAVATAICASSLDAFAADDTERTSMPEYCSNRDVVCVLPSGAPGRVVGAGGSASTTATPSTQTGATTGTAAQSSRQNASGAPVVMPSGDGAG